MASLPVPLAKPFDLGEVLPWGRNKVEYLAMFDLFAWAEAPGAENLPAKGPVLDVAGGPSSFAAEMAALGGTVVACDPLYRGSKALIAGRIAQAREIMMESTRAARHRFVWQHFKDPEALEATRMAAMKFFLEDYEEGAAAGRYVAGALPSLPFADDSFPLALCSHFLFLYSTQFDTAFHQAALRELLRVAGEVRVFPLLDLDGQTSRHLAPVRRTLEAEGWRVEVAPVPYEFQRGGNQMLRVGRF